MCHDMGSSPGRSPEASDEVRSPDRREKLPAENAAVWFPVAVMHDSKRLGDAGKWFGMSLLGLGVALDSGENLTPSPGTPGGQGGARVRLFFQTQTGNPHPNPLPEYRERE
jgi:hypothetical protein